MFDGCSSFNMEQPFQPPLITNPSSSWLQTPPSQMPWGVPIANQPSVMRFTGDSSTTDFLPLATGRDSSSALPYVPKSQSKRKSWDCDIESNAPPVKQLITEEKMAENLNCLHISNSYVSHQIGSSQPMSIPLPESTTVTSTEATPQSSTSPPSSTESSLLDSDLNLKERTVSLCEQLRKLISESSVIPSPLLAKVERPTNALVLWKPPGESIFKSVVKANSDVSKKEEVSKQDTMSKPSMSELNSSGCTLNQSTWDDLMDNNNSVSVMDLNLFSSDVSRSSPIEPSEVPLPDDEFMDLPEGSMMDF